MTPTPDGCMLALAMHLAQTATNSLGNELLDGVFIAGTIVTTWVIGRLVATAIRITLYRLARRGLLRSGSAWRTRVPRVLAESVPVAELRRQQRLNAAAAMFGRLAKIALWLLAALVVLNRLDVDVIIAVSGAGFLGAAVAIGGQNSVHDYLNGLHVLLEDRYGEGDEVELFNDIGGDAIRGTVTRIGAFATRVETDSGTFHIANRRAFQVKNISQSGSPRLFGLSTGPTATAETVSQVVASKVAEIGAVISFIEVAQTRQERGSAATWRIAARFSRPMTNDEIDFVRDTSEAELR